MEMFYLEFLTSSVIPIEICSSDFAVILTDLTIGSTYQSKYASEDHELIDLINKTPQPLLPSESLQRWMWKLLLQQSLHLNELLYCGVGFNRFNVSAVCTLNTFFNSNDGHSGKWLLRWLIFFPLHNLQTGLIVACYQGYVDVVIALTQCPYVDVNWQDNEGNTALMTAAQAGKGN